MRLLPSFFNVCPAKYKNYIYKQNVNNSLCVSLAQIFSANYKSAKVGAICAVTIRVPKWACSVKCVKGIKPELINRKKVFLTIGSMRDNPDFEISTA